MKKVILLSAFSIILSTQIKAQDKPKSKTDTLTEKQVIEISQLLNIGEQVAGNSDKVTTAQYNQFHERVVKIDSVLGILYTKWHPVKKATPKDQKPKN